MTARAARSTKAVARSLARDLWKDYERFLLSAHPDWGPMHLKRTHRGLRRHHLRQLVWRSPSGKAAALVVWLSRPDASMRVVALIARPPNLATLREVVDRIEHRTGRRLHAISDAIAGVPARVLSPFLRHRGFRLRLVVGMRLPATARVRPRRVPAALRPIVPGDRGALIRLYMRAYAPKPGEFWLSRSPDLRGKAEEAANEVVARRGHWTGVAEPSGCWGALSGGRLVGAVLVTRTRPKPPYVTDVMVDSGYQGRGIGHALMIAAIAALRAEASLPVELHAVRGGPGFRLYSALGFRVLRGPAGHAHSYWVVSSGVNEPL